VHVKSALTHLDLGGTVSFRSALKYMRNVHEIRVTCDVAAERESKTLWRIATMRLTPRKHTQ